MLEHVLLYLDMHGHGKYVWPAYLSVAVILALQWLLPYRRWRRYRREAMRNAELKQANAE